MRLALGPGRTRLVRQLLTESMMPALLGGAAGLLIATWATSLAGALLPSLPYNITLALDFGLDARVFAFAAVVSLLTGVVFGLAPALQATKSNVVPALKGGGGGGGMGTRRSRLRGALVVGQVAVSLLLLVGAALFVRSLLSAKSIEPGFDHENVLAVSLVFALNEYEEEEGKTFYQRLLDGVRTIPGVESASLNECVPLGFTMPSRKYWVEGRTPPTDSDGRDVVAEVHKSVVSPSDFATLGIPLLRGRDFNEHDTADAPSVVIVNKAFAGQAWPGEDPLGKRISTEGVGGPFLEVVGVVETAKYVFIGEEPRTFSRKP